ncbi:hypothetical protein MPER_01458, partial [Moniliophthora perniciosa FA553]
RVACPILRAFFSVRGLCPNIARSGVRYEEGTALMPAVAKKESLPVSHRYPLLSLDEDGYDIPSDW